VAGSSEPFTQAIFIAQLAYQRRNALAVGVWQKGARLITLPIVLCKVRKFFFEERHEDFFRAGLQKERIGVNPVATGLGRCLDQ